MQDIPKIVVKRFRAAKPVTSDPHPDADLLTAFAEQSLSGGERAHVMEHLARCGDCRDVVALALPATEAVIVARSGSRDKDRGGWFGIPILRWGVVAAGLIVVTSLGILQYRNHHDQGKMLVSIRVEPREQLADKVVNPAAEVETRTLKPTASNTGREKAATPAQGEVLGAGSAGGIGRGSNGTGFARGAGSGATPHHNLAFAPAPTAAAAKPNPASGSAQQVAIPRASTTVEVSGMAPALQTETAENIQPQDHLIQNEQVRSLPLNGRNEAVVRAKPTTEPGAPVSMTPAPVLSTDPNLMKGATPRWTIGANGALQRSLDGGQTWLDVNIAADSSTSSNLVSSSVAEVTGDARSPVRTVASAKAKSNAAPAAGSASAPDQPIFRALSVASNATEVWAGGSAGVLYHTLDGGNHWVRVLPSASGVALSGDIVSIQFSEAGNGRITTSTTEVWTTHDAGQTWHKQP
jgi:hypothetical protein